MDPGTLKERIRERAHDLGFDLVGFAPAVTLGREGTRLRGWLAQGYHGSMGWMARNAAKREDPSLVLPGVQTIVSAAVNYYTGTRHEGRPGTGKISRYAWGDDYHEVVTGRLRELLAYVTSIDPTISGKVYTDTGPVLEKAWAQRAGIGWQGKHTNVISMELGSWIFLGELLLTARIEPDAPETDHCGNCVLCIEACPTGAITEPYVLDSTLCLSYLTIEHRGSEFPPGVEGNMDGWLYGCDTCQDVCPWNANAGETAERSFAARPGNSERELEDVLVMGEEEFAKLFRGSPIKRTKLSGLKRNAAALRNETDRTGGSLKFEKG